MQRSWVPVGEDAPVTNSDAYGFGWGVGSINGRRLVSHPGDLGAYHSDLAYFPDRRDGLVVLTARNSVLAVLAGCPSRR